MQIRHAVTADLADIQAIYGFHVLHGTGSFEERPPSVEEMALRLQDGIWLVAANPTGIVGYARAGQYRPRSAYRHCAEDSVYVRPDRQGQGIGAALLGALVAAAEAAGYRQMVAVIGDAANSGSIELHRRLRFCEAGRLHAAGLKFGRWLDVVYMQRPIGAGDAAPPHGTSR